MKDSISTPVSCRKCGGIHSFGRNCREEPSWLQKMQMAIEDAEGFCKKIRLAEADAKKINDRFIVIRKELHIPREAIYTDKKRSAPDSKKKAKPENLAKARTNMNRIEDLIYEKSSMDEEMRKWHKEIFNALKKAMN